MRIALGCMRLSTELERDEDVALATLEAAKSAGMVVFDTARAYGRDEKDAGHNERIVGRALANAQGAARVITKCGMRREGGAWIADGRAKRISDDVLASVEALGETTINTLLLHAPDRRTGLATSARALVRAAEKAGVKRIGVSNVSRKQLEEFVHIAPISSVSVAVGAYDDLAVRSGVVSYCIANGIEVLAHAPLGGPKRVGRLGRDELLRRIADRTSASPIEIFLAYLLAVSDRIVPIVGARRPETVASMVRATKLVLADDDLAALDRRFSALGSLRAPPKMHRAGGTAGAASEREVVLMMGVPGAGKSSAAEALVARGYERLNRDSLGGTLRGIVQRLDERLRAGAERVVLDNTYVTRATRNDVVRVAGAHGVGVRCVFFDTPTADAHVNVVVRMIRRFGAVLEPEEIARRAREDPAALGPSAVRRMTRDLELPADDEGFASFEVVPFVRTAAPPATATNNCGALAMALDSEDLRDARGTLADELTRAVAQTAPGTRCLLYAWRPDANDAGSERLRVVARGVAVSADRTVEVALCTHPAGPPICWCRPPLPGLWVSFAHRHGIDVLDVVHWCRKTA
jgi:aryl-alcohol dehydrogenase-like predicted oxidoreductase